MKLRRSLAFRYASIVVVCLGLLAGLAHHEFVTEPQMRQLLGIPELPESAWSEWAEVFFYGMIPLVFGAGWWLMRRTLAPIDTLTRGVERIHADNLREPLPRTGHHDEVDRLTEVFNDMTSRLDKSFQQVRQFTLHASHELKTPLTVMRAELETMLRQADQCTPQQRDCMSSLLDEVDRLTKIVEGLTLLSKADAGEITLDLKPVPLENLVRECFEDAQVLAEPLAVRVTLTECASPVVLGDRHRLRQLLLNLTDNAVKYNQPGGTIAMALRIVNHAAEFTITNTGKGLPPEMQRRVFDRFVRGDNARSSAVDGCGLGLTICQWIVKSHCGSIRLDSAPGVTTTVTVRLPQATADQIGRAA